MKRLYLWWSSLTKRARDSIIIPTAAIGFISSVFTVLGVSLDDCGKSTFWFRLGIVLAFYILTGILAYFILGCIYRDSVSLSIRQTPVSISYEDIFNVPAWRVIGCDTHFDTRTDDIVISKESLHGQLLLKHGKTDEILSAVETEAKRLGLTKNGNGLYDFPLGTIIRYDSSVDHATYLMLAMTELNADCESHTDMARFDHMLMRMWKEISRVYAGHTIAMPLLGTGITRFDDGPKGKDNLLRCMLCTLNSSGVSLKSEVKILLHSNIKDISLYEYKELGFLYEKQGVLY